MSETEALSIEVQVESFGYLHGPPPEAHLTIDLRTLLYNPHADPAMRELTGLDPVVRTHVMATRGAGELLHAVRSMVTYLVPLDPTQRPPWHRDDEDARLRVAFGCAGGRHRSVAMAAELEATLFGLGYSVAVEHRDVDRPVVQRIAEDEVMGLLVREREALQEALQSCCWMTPPPACPCGRTDAEHAAVWRAEVEAQAKIAGVWEQQPPASAWATQQSYGTSDITPGNEDV